MDTKEIFGIILLVVWFILFVYGIIYWGNLAWRHPDKLKEKAVQMYTSNTYVWTMRILTLLMGLAILTVIVILLIASIREML